MASTKKSAWKLPVDEVIGNGSGGTNTHRRKLTRSSRSVDERSWRITLIHTPTGIEAEGEVPKGNYSKKQMQEARAELWGRLYVELEKKVAKHLRLPGW